MIKNYYLFALLLTGFTVFAIICVQAQDNPSKITGQIVDQLQKPVDYAQIALLNAKDSTLVKMAFSNEQGLYTLDHIKAGSYRVLASAMNHGKVYSAVFTLSSSPLNLPLLVLTSESKTLVEVKVSTRKPFLEHRMDKTIVNVENSSLLAGTTALDILTKSPGIVLDRDDNISMSGKQGVLILIDGKQSYLSNAEVANMLRNMQSNQIEAIELISSPSAKYDASGTAGVINIRTIKDKRFGMNGSVTTGAGYGQTSKYNGGTNLNFRKNKINIFGNYNYSDAGNEGWLTLNRIVKNEGTTTLFKQKTEFNDRREAQTYRAGVDYFLNPKHTIGFQVSGYNNKTTTPDNPSYTNITAESANQPLISGFTQVHSAKNAKFRNLGYNLNYAGKLDTTGKELTVDLDYSKYKGNDLDDRSVDTSYQNSKGRYLVKNNTISTVEAKTIKADYVHPVNKNTKFEAGIKSSIVTTNNNLEYLRSIADANHYQIIPEYTNKFLYNENINAAYLNFSKQYQKLGVQLGFRAEYTHTNARLAQTPERDYHYIDFFPSAALSYKVNASNELGLSYSRRIDRPDYDNLNPTLHELDNKTFIKGNEFLRPQYSNSIEVSHTFKSFLTTSLSYTATTDAMINVGEQNDQTAITYMIMRNLNSEKVYALNIFAAKNLFKWWQLSNNLTVYYAAYAYTYNNNDFHGGQTSANYSLTNAFTVVGNLVAEASVYYQSSMTHGYDKMKSFSFVDAGLRKSFIANKLNVKVSISDIFNKRVINGTTLYRNIDATFSGRKESRIVRVNMTYRFGSSTVTSARNRKNATEEEAKRMKQ